MAPVNDKPRAPEDVATRVAVQREKAAGNLPLAVQAYHCLENLITTLDLRPGAVFTVEELSHLVEIGRTPVREALKQLERDGLVSMQRSHGVVITEIDAGHQIQILDVRRSLEVLASRRAAENGNERQRRTLELIADEFIDAVARQDDRRFMRVGTTGYNLLSDMSRNPYLKKHLLATYSLSRRFYFANIEDPREILEPGRLHARRFRAVASGDVAAAETATHELMDFFVRFARAREPAATGTAT